MIREIAKCKVTISSAFRCREYNEKVGGKSGSIHMYEAAVDLVFDYLDEKVRIYEFLDKYWNGGLGWYEKHIHIDTSRRRRW